MVNSASPTPLFTTLSVPVTSVDPVESLILPMLID